jgi:hypothetical protein
MVGFAPLYPPYKKEGLVISRDKSKYDFDLSLPFNLIPVVKILTYPC